MFTSIAVLLVALWLIVASQGPVSSTLTLILGVVAALLGVADLLRVLPRRVP